jgi:hypothetical protein
VERTRLRPQKEGPAEGPLATSGVGRQPVAAAMICGPQDLGLFLMGSQKEVCRPRSSGAFPKGFRGLALDWLSGVGCCFLGVARELLRLFGERFKLLARVRGRQLEKFRR